jgi:hypothetical protein
MHTLKKISKTQIKWKNKIIINFTALIVPSMQVDTTLNTTSTNSSLNDTIAIETKDSLTQIPNLFITESKKDNFDNFPKEKHSGDWIFFSLLTSLILIAIANFLYRKRFRDLFRAFWARNYSNQLMREGNIFKEQIGLTLFISFLISTPLFLSFSIIHFFPEPEIKLDFFLLLKIMAALLILWGYRILFVKLTSVLFKTYRASSEVLTQIFIFNLISGIALAPFSILYYYSGFSTFLILGMVLGAIIQIYRFIRLFIIGFSYSIFSSLHLFLYLCTLEILPIAVLLKILVKSYL